MSMAMVKIIGIGGLGCSIVHGLMGQTASEIELIAVDTDQDFLSKINAHSHILIGNKIAKGRSLQRNFEQGALAALVTKDKLLEIIRGADMLFLLAGMGGGVGTGAIPEIARIARKAGVLTVAMVTKPFTFEDAHRNVVAEVGLNEVTKSADTTIVIPINHLISTISPKTSGTTAFRVVEPVLINLVKQVAGGLFDVITEPPLICICLNDLKEVLGNAGYAYIGIGYGSGKQRGTNAARAAIESPLMGASISKATRIMAIMKMGLDGTIYEDIRAAGDQIAEAVDPEANIIIGGLIERSKIDFTQVILIATGLA